MKLGKPIDLSAVGKTRQRIAAIGIELEGGWEKLPEGVQLARDGSISGLKKAVDPVQMARYQELMDIANNGGLWTKAQQKEANQLHLIVQSTNTLSIGELPSPALEVTGADPKWKEWIRRFYPSHVNHTCGMHVHMSFKREIHYSRLMVPEYPGTVVEEFIKWTAKEGLSPDHPFMPRLADKSTYCKHAFYAEDQAKQSEKQYNHDRPGCRYTVINYSYSRHSTVECRLLPMFEGVEQAIRAIDHLLMITNKFLVVTRGREKKIPAMVIIEDDQFSDHQIAYI